MWNWSFLTQLHVVWHQASPIWLMGWPQPPNCYLLWGRFMFEVVRNVVISQVSEAALFVLEPPIRREIEWTNYTTNQKRRLIWYLSIQLSNVCRRDKQAISPGRVRLYDWLAACQFSHKFGRFCHTRQIKTMTKSTLNKFFWAKEKWLKKWSIFY